MKNIINNFYKKFDEFLEHSVSGNIGLKTKITAVITGILIFLMVFLFIIVGLKEFEITIPAQGKVARAIDKDTVEFKVLVSDRYRESVRRGQKSKIWILNNGKMPLYAKITKIEDVAGESDFSVYLDNVSPCSSSINKELINKKVECRIIIGRKKLYKLLLK